MLTDEQKEAVSEIIRETLRTLDIPARVSPEDNLSGTEFNIYTPDSRLLIGQHGANLQALQFLVSAAALRRFPEIERFVIDIDDYRKQREYRLRETAKRTLDQVKKTGQPVTLEPMNAYERRIIHAYLSNEYGIDSESVGRDPNRKIVVKPKEKGDI